MEYILRVAQPQWAFTEALVGAGGIDSSVEDMAKLLLFLMKPDQSPLGKAVIASKTVLLRGPQGAFGHSGSISQKDPVLSCGTTARPAAQCIHRLDPRNTNGVFILSNNGEEIATGLGAAIIGEEK